MWMIVHPELLIGIYEPYRGQGVGHTLLTNLIVEARRRGVGMCLRVRDNNFAIRLYEQLGFVHRPGVNNPNSLGRFTLGMMLPTD